VGAFMPPAFAHNRLNSAVSRSQKIATSSWARNRSMTGKDFVACGSGSPTAVPGVLPTADATRWSPGHITTTVAPIFTRP
jgi:hypothetical protein